MFQKYLQFSATELFLIYAFNQMLLFCYSKSQIISYFRVIFFHFFY